MRTEKRRTEKYEKKIDGNVVKSRIDSYGEKQKSYFKSYAIEQARAEEIVKSFLGGKVPTNMLIYYIVFAKEILGLKYKHEGNILQTEALITAKKWEGRGLNLDYMVEIAKRLGVFIPYATCIPGIDDYTISLIPFDLLDGPTDFVDYLGVPWYAYNGAHITTETYKFGGASGAFDGVDDYIITDYDSLFTFGSYNFTIECWVKLAFQGASGGVAGVVTSGGWFSWIIYIDSYGYIQFWAYTNLGFIQIISNKNITDLDFHHVAIIRNGGTIRIFLDGENVGEGYPRWGSIIDFGGRLAFGRFGDQNAGYFAGYIDEARISIGVARWWDNFEPPKLPYCQP